MGRYCFPLYPPRRLGMLIGRTLFLLFTIWVAHGEWKPLREFALKDWFIQFVAISVGNTILIWSEDRCFREYNMLNMREGEREWKWFYGQRLLSAGAWALLLYIDVPFYWCYLFGGSEEYEALLSLRSTPEEKGFYPVILTFYHVIVFYIINTFEYVTSNIYNCYDFKPLDDMEGIEGFRERLYRVSKLYEHKWSPQWNTPIRWCAYCFRMKHVRELKYKPDQDDPEIRDKRMRYCSEECLAQASSGINPLFEL